MSLSELEFPGENPLTPLPTNKVEQVHRAATELEKTAGISLAELTHILLLDSVKGLGPQKFKEIYRTGLSAQEVVNTPERLPSSGKTGDKLRAEIATITDAQLIEARSRALRQLERAAELKVRILTYTSPAYPRNALESNNPVPIIWALGDLQALAQTRAVACVGSRHIRQPYTDRQRAFAAHAARLGWVVVSGFALGADTVAHQAAASVGGRTVMVMPCGLDRPFPPENRSLWSELTARPGVCAISEFALGTAASTLTLRKRNKLIVALALGVLVGQSTTKGGAMNAFRFALEQSKPLATFEPDGTPDSSGNEQIASRRTGATSPKSASEVTTFSITGTESEEWDSWLRRLSSSI